MHHLLAIRQMWQRADDIRQFALQPRNLLFVRFFIKASDGTPFRRSEHNSSLWLRPSDLTEELVCKKRTTSIGEASGGIKNPRRVMRGFIEAGELGFEPRQADSETAVLPL